MSLAIEVKDLLIKFGNFTAVNKISFCVKRGEIFGFLGANGAGKTTTIRMLCGLLIPTSGNVAVAGFGFEDGGKNIKTKVGYMSQKFTLYDDLTVGENMAFAAGLRKIKKSAFKKKSKELLDFIGFDKPLSTMVKNLPGGFKQELSLAVSMLHDPEIIFLDEPTSGVSPQARARFWSLIKKITKAGKTVIVTTHYMDEAEQCGRIALMRAGELIALGSPKELGKKAFPGPMIEVDGAGEDISEFLNSAIKTEGILEVQPYGLRWHLSTKRKEVMEKIINDLPKNAKYKYVEPSLEDVFIRLVEGKNR